MGFGVHRFPSAIDQNLLCGICSAVLEDAVLTPCGHSFCIRCLQTWLTRPGVISTCPECRTETGSNDIRPIHSIRNFINGLNIECDHSDRGCKAVVHLERMKAHLETCSFVPVDCAGCGVTVNRFELAAHQMGCASIQAAVDEDLPGEKPQSIIPNGANSSEVTELACRVATLEMQMRRMKKDLELAELKNKRLDRELKQTKDDLEEKRTQLLDQQYVDYDPDYEYGYAPYTVAKLAQIISKFLHKKPSYLDKDRTFDAIKRCYDNYSRCGDKYEQDVLMLLATANASNWFDNQQRLNFHCWLSSIARYRQFARSLSFAGSSSSANPNTNITKQAR
ncbi:unnamed protein product [Owenia fusiformis]|uniref:Uncharacterized protein n=1 Tax=Owenia fusiformis TaxID=6347 RepID=A0A8J1U2G9_OWEFU|nr:unnamed protein product [Owenia fusiformis]